MGGGAADAVALADGAAIEVLADGDAGAAGSGADEDPAQDASNKTSKRRILLSFSV